jgi:CRISPR-associated endonuclease/helicase Cas3
MATMKKPPETKEIKAKQSGVTITDEMIEELAREAQAGYDLRRARRRRVGRPSLGSGVSPRLQFRVPPDLYAAAEQRAQQEGRAVSDVARDALRAYVQGASS